MWVVLYDDGTSLTTASERIACSLAEAERQRGRRVTVRRLDDVETHPRGTEKPARPPGRARGDGPVRPGGTDKLSVPGPSSAVAGTGSVPEPIRPAERFARPKPISEPEPAPHPSRSPHLDPNRPKARSQPTRRSSPGHSQHQSRLAKADHRNRSPHLNCPRFWGRRKRWSRCRPRNQPRCPNRPAKPHGPNSPANPNRPARPRLREAADSCSTRSLPPASSSLPHWSITGMCCLESVPIPAPVRRRSAVLPIARSCYLRWISRRSCTSATQSMRHRRPRSHRRSRRVRRPGHQGRRIQPPGQPGRRHLPKARSPRRVRLPAAGRQPLPGEDDIDEDIDEDTSDCHQRHRGARSGRARGRSGERAGARRGVDLGQRTRARCLRLRGEQPDAAGLSASFPGVRGASCAAVPA